jgi:hypothetical protein
MCLARSKMAPSQKQSLRSHTFKSVAGACDQYDCVGAVIANSISMNGHFSFHYDEAPGRTGPSQGFVITSWSEE